MAKPPDPAVQQAQAALAPTLAEIQRQQAEEAKRAANAQHTAAASAQGLNQVLGQIPGQIQQDYKQAGDSTSAYAKGFSAAFQEGSEQTAAELQAFLAKQGGPQQIQAAGQNGGDVLYGLGGFIPATGLAREGAAFTAASRGLGAAALGRGQEVQALIGRESRDKLSQLDALLRGEKAKIPGLVNEYRAQLADAEAKRRGLDQNEVALRAKLGNDEFNRLYKTEQLKLSQANLKFKQAQERFDQLLATAKLDLSEADYELAVKREQRLSKTKPKGGFSQKQRQEMAQTAFETAADDFRGYKDEDGNVVPPRPPVETLRDLIAAGVPFSIAIKAIQRFARGKRPADVDAQTWALWRATLKWTKK